MRLRDYVWNHREMLVPIGTAILGLGWCVVQPSPEPIVVILSALLTAFVIHLQSTDRWHSMTQGQLFVLSFRGMEEDDIKAFVDGMLKRHPFIIKWQIQGDGEFRELFLDVVGEIIVMDACEVARHTQCKLYMMKRNGRLIWETRAI